MINNKIVILPCAGHGSRFGGALPKQYIVINQHTILEHTLNIFLAVPQIGRIIVVTSPDDPYIDDVFNKRLNSLSSKIEILKLGGTTRAHTVKNAVNAINCASDDWILVHDVARCCLTSAAVSGQITALEQESVGGILAISALDTIKHSQNGSIIDKTLERDTIYQAQTPQMFRAHILKDALNLANLNLVTDEASAVEQINLPVRIISGESSNIKITYPIDIKIAKIILDSQQCSQ